MRLGCRRPFQNVAFRATLESYIRTRLASRPDLVAKVTPEFAPFVRQLIVDNGWYDALLRDNVELVAEGVAAMTPTGIVSASGKEVPVDLLGSATGFQTSRYVFPARYVGLDGVELQAFWERDVARAHLGTTVPGFPNLFLLYGPNSQPRGGSLPGWFETWARYSAQIVVGMIEGGHRWMTVRRDVYERYNAAMDQAAKKIVWTSDPSDVHNCYLDTTGRSSVNAPWRGEELYGFYFPLKLDEFQAA